MNCFYCKGETEKSTTTYMEEVGKNIVLIKNVPCDKCTQCGETFLSGEVARHIEEILKEFEKVISEISIVDYSAA